MRDKARTHHARSTPNSYRLEADSPPTLAHRRHKNRTMWLICVNHYPFLSGWGCSFVSDCCEYLSIYARRRRLRLPADIRRHIKSVNRQRGYTRFRSEPMAEKSSSFKSWRLADRDSVQNEWQSICNREGAYDERHDETADCWLSAVYSLYGPKHTKTRSNLMESVWSLMPVQTETKSD